MQIENKFDIVKSRLSSILQCNKDVIYARKCDIREVLNKEKENLLIKTTFKEIVIAQ